MRDRNKNKREQAILLLVGNVIGITLGVIVTRNEDIFMRIIMTAFLGCFIAFALYGQFYLGGTDLDSDK